MVARNQRNMFQNWNTFMESPDLGIKLKAKESFNALLCLEIGPYFVYDVTPNERRAYAGLATRKEAILRAYWGRHPTAEGSTPLGLHLSVGPKNRKWDCGSEIIIVKPSAMQELMDALRADRPEGLEGRTVNATYTPERLIALRVPYRIL